jgi:lipopolysaccharide/colanic/teichoic acid biosynthesis glycosyltransferase
MVISTKYPLQTIWKRIFDLLGSIFGIIIFFFPVVIIIVLIKLSLRGPVFYTQRRIGKNGRPFSMVKFCTMYAGEEDPGTITTSTDSRITLLGRFLRRFKLDEIPQLVNILIGEMSFVGPRPDVAGYADVLTGDDRIILSVLPGITGPATLLFRFEEQILSTVDDPLLLNDSIIWPYKVKLNKIYVETWNMWRDVKCILVTVCPMLNSYFKLIAQSPRTAEDVLKIIRDNPL